MPDLLKPWGGTLLRQCSLRLLLVFLVSLAVVALLVGFLYQAAVGRARAGQAHMLSAYWTRVFIDWERQWQHQVHHLATRSDLARFLQQSPDSWASDIGFLQTLGRELNASALVIRTRDRQVLLATDSLGRELANLDCVTLPWCYDDAQGRLYRVYSDLLWSGSAGMVVLELWYLLDDALLTQVAESEVSLQLLWRNTVVASSPAATAPWPVPGAYSSAVGCVIPLPGASGFGPVLAVESRALTAISAGELAGAGALMLAGVVFCIWIALGLWQRRLARRLVALADASRRFIAEYRETPEILTQLEKAQTGTGDEIDSLANALSQLTRAVVERDLERQDREERLAESEAQLREIYAVIGVGLYVVDARHCITFVNRDAETMLGWAPGELLSQHAHAVTHSQLPEDKRHELEHCIVHHALRTGEPSQSLEEWLVRKDGTLFPASLSVRPIRHDNHVAGAVVAFVDETERRDMEESLRHSEERLRLAMDAARIGIWDYEAARRILHWNPEAAPFFGAFPGSTQGGLADFLATLHPDDKPHVQEVFQNWQKSHYEKGKDDSFQVEYRVAGPGDTKRWILLLGKPCPKTAASQIRLRGAAVDVTESRRVAERYAAIIRASLDGFLLVDLQGCIVEVNDAYCQLIGYTQAELLAMSINDLKETGDHSDTTARIQQLMRSGPGRFETRHRRKDGSMIELDISVQYLTTEQRICSFARDVSARRLVENTLQRAALAAEAASRAKTEFLAAVSHEIRTPMNAIMGLSHLALNQDPGPRPTEHLLRIQSETRRLLGIVNDILDYSKSEAGRLALETVLFVLDDVFAATDNMMRPKAEDKALELSFVLPSPPLPPLKGDPSRLGQVLRNLIDNAIKFTEQGSVRVSVRELDRAPDSILCEFRVEDTGIGLDSTSRAWIFETFSQGDASASRRYGGLGLGLAISRRLVRMMGGDIRVDSEAGRGSEFYFTARFGLDHVSDQTQNFRDRPRLSVLVVDGEVARREELSRQLEAFGLAVFSAGSSADCLEALERIETVTGRDCELVFLHRQLPHPGASDTVRSIFDRSAPEARPSVFLLAGPDDQEAESERRKLGIEGVLSSPASPEQLFEAVMKVFGRRSGLFETPLAQSRAQLGLSRQPDDSVGTPSAPDLTRAAALIHELSEALASDTYIDDAVLDALSAALAGSQAGSEELARLRRAVLAFSYDPARVALRELSAALGLSPKEEGPA